MYRSNLTFIIHKALLTHSHAHHFPIIFPCIYTTAKLSSRSRDPFTGNVLNTDVKYPLQCLVSESRAIFIQEKKNKEERSNMLD